MTALPPPIEVARPVTPPEEQQPTLLSPADRSDAASIDQKLRELGYLPGNVSASAAIIRQAVRDFKIVNGVGSTDEVDPATIQSLNAGAALHKSQSFLGSWSATEACLQGEQLDVSTAQAKTDGGVCQFNRVTFAGGGWKIRARCQVGANSWTANISFVVDGRRLEWSSEKGRQTYYRCQ